MYHFQSRFIGSLSPADANVLSDSPCVHFCLAIFSNIIQVTHVFNKTILYCNNNTKTIINLPKVNGIKKIEYF